MSVHDYITVKIVLVMPRCKTRCGMDRGESCSLQLLQETTCLDNSGRNMNITGGLVANNSSSTLQLETTLQLAATNFIIAKKGCSPSPPWLLFLEFISHLASFSGSREYRYQTSITCPSFVAINTSGHSTCSFYTGI